MMFNKDASPSCLMSSSFSSEVCNSLDDFDEMMKSNKFLKLIEQLNASTFSDDINLIKIRDMINEVELTSSQWKRVTLLLINNIILFKNISSSSEANEGHEIFKNEGMPLSLENHFQHKKNQKSKNQSLLRRTKDPDLKLIASNKKEKQRGGDLWNTGEEQLVPFEIGLKILDGSIGSNDNNIGEETKQKIKKIEDDACKMAAKRMNRNPEYQRLFDEKEHWKYLAKTRLIELENEIDFRYELVFGDDKKKYL